MTDRLTELLKDTPEEAAYDEAGRQAIIWGNLLKAEVRPEVQALRDRVRELQDALRAVQMDDVPEGLSLFGWQMLVMSQQGVLRHALRATLEGEATG